MAEVYVGRHITADGKFGPMVAMKRLLPHLKNDPMVVRMFLNEARITAQIDHPNVVRIVDLGHENGEPYIAMELLEGRSFAEVRQRAAEEGRRVPLGITLRILADACRGLDAAHRAVDDQGRFLCIVHRDFTPDNIHVGVNGAVKVIDFGIAKTTDWGTGTEPGTLKGKFFYMSPEMIAGREVDHRADLFAAAVMLYEQLCGRRPFTGISTDEVVQRISEGRPRRPTEFDPSVPPALEAICLMALDKDPEKRFPSLQEFIGAIESVGGTAQLATRDEVAGYIDELFPAERDPRRQTLRRARQADPSIPGQTAAHEIAAPEGELREPPSSEPTAQHAPGVPAKGPSRPLARAALRPLLKWGAVVLAVAALVAGAVAAWRLLVPDLKPSERLASAERLPAGNKRAGLLLPLLKDSRSTASQLSRAGELLLAAGAHDAALELAEGFAGRFPKDARAPLLEARAAIQLRVGKRAEAALERAVSLSPNDPEPDLLAAELREAQGDLYGALDALNRAARKRPHSIEIAARRGYLLSQAGKLDEASEVLQTVLQKRNDADAAAELAFVRFRQNQFDEAAALLRRALRKDPDLAKAHYYLGATLFRQRDFKGAERAYLEADRLAPSDARALLGLCGLYAHIKAKDLENTRAELATRFPARSASLLGQCQ